MRRNVPCEDRGFQLRFWKTENSGPLSGLEDDSIPGVAVLYFLDRELGPPGPTETGPGVARRYYNSRYYFSRCFSTKCAMSSMTLTSM